MSPRFESKLLAVTIVAPFFVLGGCAELWDEPAEATNSPARMGRTTNTATPAETPTPVGTDQYVKKAAIADQFEIQSSQIAIQKTSNSGVKAFAQMMVKDHTASSNKLKAILSQDQLGLTADGMLDGPHQAKIDQLRSAPQASFDEIYMGMQSAGHKEALELHSSYAQAGDNETLKGFAAEVTPVVQHHLDDAQKLDQSLKGSKPVSSVN
jgi:putative membrane protein